MNGRVKWITGALLLFSLLARGQEKPAQWDLKSCIDYAKAQNIQIKKSKVSLQESLESTRQSKAALLPSLSFSTSHNLVNHPKSETSDKNDYSGSYGLNTSVDLYSGGRLRKNIKVQELQDRIQELTIQEAENNIELAITETFVQLLYANETVDINRNAVEISKAQRDRAEQLLAAGSISTTDLAQLESQYNSDKYQLVAAQTTLEEVRLQLKQLLELEVTDNLELSIPEIPDSEVLTVLPGKVQVYETSLRIMPQIEYSRIHIDAAGLGVATAKAGYLPSLRLTAGIGSGHVSGSSFTFGTQLKNSFNESVGLSLSIPIFSNRSNKTAVKLAQLNVEASELDYIGIQKDLLKSVEQAYLDATSSQAKYGAAIESLKASEMSFKLVEEQFNLGMKNTVELLTEKNSLLSAQQEVVQSKYMSILNLQLLNFYQGKPIEIK